MTREEAIARIKGHKSVHKMYEPRANYISEALEMAIKALEQEPCDDTISRQAVLDYIYNDLGLGDEENGKDVERQMELESSYRYVKSLSPVTSQPKIGQWIKYGVPRCGEQHYKCTLCEYYINFGQWGELYTKEFKYCPNCGAKMEVEE